MKSKSKLLVITGPDGSGKSSIVESLKSSFSPRFLQVLSIWDSWGRISSISSSDIQRYLSQLEPTARSLFLAHALLESWSEGQKTQAEWFVFDSFWYKYAISESLMRSSAWNLLSTLFPRPNVVFYLECLPPTALGRKRGSVSAYESGFAKATEAEEEFLSLQSQAQILWQRLEAKEGPWTHLREDLSLGDKVKIIELTLSNPSPGEVYRNVPSSSL